MKTENHYCIVCGQKLDADSETAENNALLAFRIMWMHDHVCGSQRQESETPPLEKYVPYIEMLCATAYKLTHDKDATTQLVCATLAAALQTAANNGLILSPKQQLLSILRSKFLE